MILKLLLIIVVIAIVYFIFIKKKPLKNNSKKSSVRSDKKQKNSGERQESNEMIECSTCGIYSELDESLLSNGKYYCSVECVEKA